MGFLPIPELEMSDAFLDIIWLTGNGIMLTEPTDDPWYGLIKKVATKNDVLPYVYIREEAASPLACISRDQWCNPNLPEPDRCSPLTDAYHASEQVQGMWTSQEAINRSTWFSKQLGGRKQTFTALVSYLGEQALSTKFNIAGGVQAGSIPKNQWQLDVEY